MYLLFQYINKAALTICLTLLFLYACSPSKKTEVSASKYDSIQLKFAKHLNVEPAEIRNLRLYRFINEWLKTPYKWGGTTKAGIDCSAFVERLLADVYDVDVPRTSVQQFFTKNVVAFSSKKYLSEGDLVFFKKNVDDTFVSHVGLYLQNNMFINAETTNGVNIASLGNPYWKKRFFAAGKVKLI